MLDISTRGAAFLAPAAEVPPVDTRLGLLEMQSSDPLVCEDAGPVPRFARVLRHDGEQGLTRRVAVRFETDARSPMDERPERVATMLCPQPPGPPLVVPPGIGLPAQPCCPHAGTSAT